LHVAQHTHHATPALTWENTPICTVEKAYLRASESIRG
jgi:hypothetical protein